MKKEETSKTYNIASDVKEVIVREGAAQEIRDKRTISIVGILDAPYQFLEPKLSLYKSINAHALVNLNAGSIELNLNDSDYFQDKVKGVLSPGKDLEQFQINKNTKFTLHDLLKLIKRTKFFFEDKAEHQSLIVSMQNFNAKITTEIQKHHDNRGNNKNLLERISTIDAPVDFKLLIPIYEGYKALSFLVEVCLDPTDADVRFYLESSQLFDLLQSEKERIINIEVEKLKAYGCSVVNI